MGAELKMTPWYIYGSQTTFVHFIKREERVHYSDGDLLNLLYILHQLLGISLIINGTLTFIVLINLLPRS
jgi:hypothetical protein